MKKLYSFKISLKEEVIKEVEKKVRRKNKETGKMESISKTVEKTVTETIPVEVFIKHPSRDLLEDGDMFYSVWLNKYIKMGLLTRSMLTKQYLDAGGQFTEENKEEYATLMLDAFNKQTAIESLTALGKGINEEQHIRLNKYVQQLAVIRRSLTDFELLQGSIFEHTADNKARNKAVLWYVLALAWVQTEGEEPAPLFAGVDFDSRYNDYVLKEEAEDPLFQQAISQITSIVTLWYMSGANDSEALKQLLQEIEQQEEGVAEAEEEEEEKSRATKPRKDASTPKKTRGPKKKAVASNET